MIQRAFLVLALIVAACGTTPTISPPAVSTPTAGPSATPAAASTEPATPPATQPPPATSPGQSPSGPPPVTPGEVFVPLAEFPAEGAFEVTDVTEAPGGFVAVGFAGYDGEGYFGRRQGLVWRSADGLSWTRSVDPALEFVTPWLVAALDNSVYLFGRLSNCPQIFEDPCEEVPDAGNAVWRSTDGGPWERLPQLPDMQLGIVDDVVVGEGRMAVHGSAGDEEQTTTVWLSSDGANWTAASGLGSVDPISAIAIGPGRYVAFGTQYVDAVEDIQLTAAQSSDGLQYAPAHVPSLPGASIEGAVGGPAGFVGVGYATSEEGALAALTLSSADGTTWSQGSSADGSFEGSGLLEVHGLPNGGYVALGFVPRDQDFTAQDGHAWVSADGLTWTLRAPLAGSFTQFGASALNETGLVVFGAEQEEVGDEDVTSRIKGWFAPLSPLVP